MTHHAASPCLGCQQRSLPPSRELCWPTHCPPIHPCSPPPTYFLFVCRQPRFHDSLTSYTPPPLRPCAHVPGYPPVSPEASACRYTDCCPAALPCSQGSCSMATKELTALKW